MMEFYAHRPGDVKALLAAMETAPMEKFSVLQEVD